jgi:hypothetical protein
MKLWRAIRRLLPASRLAATALIILFLISALVGLAYRPEAAEAFAYTFAMLMGVFFLGRHRWPAHLWIGLLCEVQAKIIGESKRRAHRRRQPVFGAQAIEFEGG